MNQETIDALYPLGSIMVTLDDRDPNCYMGQSAWQRVPSATSGQIVWRRMPPAVVDVGCTGQPVESE